MNPGMAPFLYPNAVPFPNQMWSVNFPHPGMMPFNPGFMNPYPGPFPGMFSPNSFNMPWAPGAMLSDQTMQAANPAFQTVSNWEQKKSEVSETKPLPPPPAEEPKEKQMVITEDFIKNIVRQTLLESKNEKSLSEDYIKSIVNQTLQTSLINEEKTENQTKKIDETPSLLSSTTFISEVEPSNLEPSISETQFPIIKLGTERNLGKFICTICVENGASKTHFAKRASLRKHIDRKHPIKQ